MCVRSATLCDSCACRVAWIALLIALWPVDEATASDSLPRYRLQVGQELIYRGESQLASKADSVTLVNGDSWHVWVVRENSDGSWRLLIRHGNAFSEHRPSEEGGNEKSDNRVAHERFTFGWCDLFPNGRIVENSTLNVRLQPAKVLPRLSDDDAEALRGWAARNGVADEMIHYRRLPESSGESWKIEMIADSPQHVTFGISETIVVTFNIERGIPERLATRRTQDYAPKGAGEGKLELIDVKFHLPDSTRLLANEAERYFAAESAFQETLERKDLGVAEFKTLVEKATRELKGLAESLSSTDLRATIAETLETNDAYLTEAIENIEVREQLLGKHSEDWSTTDFDGNAHALQDYRGKVVVLDFWYRGCGWCIAGMPQIKAVADYFKGQPVAVLGMNSDDDEADARFVIEKLGLRYTNLKATGLPEKYKVTGFPTLVILDQKGVIRDMHVGYSPTLKDLVIKSVEELLQSSR